MPKVIGIFMLSVVTIFAAALLWNGLYDPSLWFVLLVNGTIGALFVFWRSR